MIRPNWLDGDRCVRAIGAADSSFAKKKAIFFLRISFFVFRKRAESKAPMMFHDRPAVAEATRSSCPGLARAVVHQGQVGGSSPTGFQPWLRRTVDVDRKIFAKVTDKPIVFRLLPRRFPKRSVRSLPIRSYQIWDQLLQPDRFNSSEHFVAVVAQPPAVALRLWIPALFQFVVAIPV
jgi:hypothetical protein